MPKYKVLKNEVRKNDWQIDIEIKRKNKIAKSTYLNIVWSLNWLPVTENFHTLGSKVGYQGFKIQVLKL